MTTLKASTKSLANDYDVALLDLDGVVYVGPNAVPTAPRALSDARTAGMRLAFVTNNAARPPDAVAEHLRSLGIEAQPSDVITSAQAAAHYLAQRLPASAAVLVCGTTGIVEALREEGLRPVFSADDAPVAVLQGYSPTLQWTQLAEAAIAVQRGVLWVATNLDSTVPSVRGPLPGNGSMVAAVQYATGKKPISPGKPDPTMQAESVRRSAAQHPIVVGDRLDTDIQGARAVGCDSLLVFSGVTTPAQLLRATIAQRPDFLAVDVSGLGYAHPAVAAGNGWAACGTWRARIDGAGVQLTSTLGAGSADGVAAEDVDQPATPTADGLDGLRACAVLCWQAGVRAVSGGDPVAQQYVEKWRIGP